MTLRDALRKLYVKEMTNIPKSITNMNGLKLIFDAKRGIYVGKDKEKKEWIAAPQNIQTPIFWYDCPKCKHKNLVTIFEDGKKSICNGCKKEFTITLQVSKDQSCYDLLKQIRKGD